MKNCTLICVEFASPEIILSSNLLLYLATSYAQAVCLVFLISFPKQDGMILDYLKRFCDNVSLMDAIFTLAKASRQYASFLLSKLFSSMRVANYFSNTESITSKLNEVLFIINTHNQETSRK